MSNIILPQASMLSQFDENTNLIVEQEGVLQRYDINNITELIQRARPRNLLNNSDFTNPVNQRGKTSYSGSGYGINGWRTNYSGDTVSITTNGVRNTINSNEIGWHLHQNIEKCERLVGKTLTVAAKVATVSGSGLKLIASFRDSSDNEISWCSVVFSSGIVMASGEVPIGTTKIRVGVYAGDGVSAADYVELEWVALYEGEYTADTLPEYQPKGYKYELLNCRQYDPSTGEYIGLREFSHSRNLLDNSDFTDPINQREDSPYTATGYTIDRWRITTGSTLTVESGYVRFEVPSDNTEEYESFYQPIHASKITAGKHYTMVIETVDGKVYVGSVTAPELIEDTAVDSETILLEDKGFWRLIAASDGTYQFRLRVYLGKSFDLVNAALYEGEYTVETAPKYVPKGYYNEFMECHRYFVRIPGAKSAYGYIMGDGGIWVSFPLPVQMRITNPTLTLSDTVGIWANGANYINFTYGGACSVRKGLLRFNLTRSSSYESIYKHPCVMQTSSVITLDADL